MRDAEITAVYSGDRVAGDFYEFLRAGRSRMLFVLLDAAGLRADTRKTLIGAQTTFRRLVPQLFAGEDLNETTAMSELCYEMNRTIMGDGVRSCPAFFGCYHEEMATLCYANAGHTPGMLRDGSGVTLLEATGLPLGLFSHTTQSAGTCHVAEGSALLVVSRGIVEAGDHAEFGIEGAKESFRHAPTDSAHELCRSILQAARASAARRGTANDLTALALVRHAVAST